MRENDSNSFYPIFFRLVGWLTCLFITLFEFWSIFFSFTLFLLTFLVHSLAWYCWYGCSSTYIRAHSPLQYPFFRKHVDEFSSLTHSFFSFMLTHDIYGRERILFFSFSSSSLVHVIDVVLIPFLSYKVTYMYHVSGRVEKLNEGRRGRMDAELMT